MTIFVKRPTGFMDLPIEIRNMIYEIVLHIDYLYTSDIYPYQNGGRTYYKIDMPHRRIGRKRYDRDFPTSLSKVSPQIFDEMEELASSAPLCLTINDSDYGMLDKRTFEKARFIPGRFKSLHSVFGKERRLHIGFEWLPFNNMSTDSDNEWFYFHTRDWINGCLRSLLPRAPYQNSTALRLITADVEIDGWEIGKDDVESFFNLLDGFITIIPPKVNVSLAWTFSPGLNNDGKARAKFGDRLVEEFARRRAAHVAHSTAAESGASEEGPFQEVEDDDEEDDDSEDDEEDDPYRNEDVDHGEGDTQAIRRE